MALALEKPTVYGVTASYWRIIFAQIDFGANRLMVNIAGYSDKEARDNGKAPLCQEQVIFEADSFISEPTRDAVYSAVKSVTEWRAAKDV